MLDSEDITGTVLYLLSASSRYVVGQNIIVDDGFSL
jgi:enoyl-[acyl-carrier-protein] reductase (NADH)